jgi:hypothetical protein
MRCAFLLLLLTIIIGCSKKNTQRINFAEIKVGEDKFVFDSLEAIFDTSTASISCNFRVYDRASNSYMVWETLSGSKWINGDYGYPGEVLPGRCVVYLHLQTYIDRFPNTYTLTDNSFTMTIDQSEKGRMHGALSGKITCYTCITYGAEVSLTKGEFEMPYSYRQFFDKPLSA